MWIFGIRLRVKGRRANPMQQSLCQKCGTLLFPREGRCRTCGFDPKAPVGTVPEVFDARKEIASLRAALNKSRAGFAARISEQVKAALRK